MRLFSKHIIFTITICISLTSCVKNKDYNDNIQSDSVVSSLLVYAATSLSDVIPEIIDSFEAKYSAEIILNTASSGTLARQIEQGATPDIFISANKQWIEYIDSIGGIIDSTVSVVAKNELVLIAPKSSRLDFENVENVNNLSNLLGTSRLSIGNPVHVPAGKYARQTILFYNWEKDLEDKILPAKDVRSALMYVEMKESPLGIVYRTDAQKSEKVKILTTFPENTHESIEYFMGLCSESNLAKEFYNYLLSKDSKLIWEKYGFIL